MDKDSALLEYPSETSSCLTADHHGMAKFRNPRDPNYVNVKNMLRWLKRKFVIEGASEKGINSRYLTCSRFMAEGC